MKYFRTALLLSTVLAVAGCVPVAAGVATPMIIQQKKVNLMNASYAAADTLSQQAGKRFAKDRPLLVSNLHEILHKGEARQPIANVDDVIDRAKGDAKPSPKVGQVISNQLRDRFMQLGYKVVDNTSRQVGGSVGEVMGTYEFLSGTMYVNLKMVDRGSGEIITLYNYSLPITYDISKYRSGNEFVMPPLF